MADPTDYDEFGLFQDNATEAGLAWHGPPTVERVDVALDDDRSLSALRWGTSPPEIVFLHGGGQNAHTWDTVALALDRPLLAIDLPGHGHSDGSSPERPLGPRSMAVDVVAVTRALAPDAAMVVGMSLGGVTAIQVATLAPALVRKLILVDVTPGVDKDKASDVVAFLAGPESFASFDEIMERTVLFNPTRSESSLRRGVLHNSVQQADGSWVWRHQRSGQPMLETAGPETGGGPAIDFEPMWDDLAAIDVPIQLLVGDRSPVVDAADKAMFTDRQPAAQIIDVVDAGHSIQGDQPIVLAGLVADFLDG